MGIPTTCVEIDPGPGDGGWEATKPFSFTHRLPALLHLAPCHQMDLGDHLRACLSIFCQVAVVLELDDGLFGLGPEDPVDLAHVEAERAETGLDL